MFSGNVDLSPKWNAGISSGYDFKNKPSNAFLMAKRIYLKTKLPAREPLIPTEQNQGI